MDDFVAKWNEISAKQCRSITEQIMKEYSDNNDTNDVFICLELVEDVFKFIDESVPNTRKYELIYPQTLEFFIKFLKKGFKELKSKHENETTTLKHEKTVLQGIIDKTKSMLDSTREENENQVRDLKDQILNMRIDVGIILIILV